MLDKYLAVCSTSKNVHISINEDVQYKQGPSSVEKRMCTSSKTYHQVLKKIGTTQRCFYIIYF